MIQVVGESLEHGKTNGGSKGAGCAVVEADG
jgi:hypothetical protein